MAKNLNQEMHVNLSFTADTGKAKAQLKDLQKNNADVDALNKLVEQLQLSNKELEENHSKEMYNLQFDFALESALNNAKCKNNKALKALLELDKITYQEGKLEGIEKEAGKTFKLPR